MGWGGWGWVGLWLLTGYDGIGVGLRQAKLSKTLAFVPDPILFRMPFQYYLFGSTLDRCDGQCFVARNVLPVMHTLINVCALRRAIVCPKNI